MSRCYRITVSESLRRTVQVEDGVESRLELLDILPPDQMQALLGAELRARGYAGDGQVLSKELEHGVTVEVDLAEGTVHVGVKAGTELDLELKRTSAAAAEVVADAKETLRKLVAHELEGEAARATEALRVDATRALEAAIGAVHAELDEAVNRATGEALKIKARQLGEVQEIHEDPETGSLTIRVRV